LEKSLVPLKFILVEDVFVLIDDGSAVAADYTNLGNHVRKQAANSPGGIGALTIIPREAKAPSPEVRNAINDLLARLGPSLRCLCWLVEGGGFHSAMVQAVLTGLRMFGRYSYATHVSTDLHEALEWMLPHLQGGPMRLKGVPAMSRVVRAQREGQSVHEL
jgi:hypothetical protein